MARTAEEVQIDLDRIENMIRSAYDVGNPDTLDILLQANERFDSELKDLTKPSRAARQASIDDATAELIAFENEERVSRELKAAIQYSRGDLVRRRENA